MKRLTALAVVMAIGFSICLQAQQNQQVTRDEAVNAALTRLTGSNVIKDRNLRGIVLTEKNDNAGNTVLYEITTDSVSLLLSGSKACYPILAKYKTPNRPLLDHYDDLPDNLRSFLDDYIWQISFCFSNDTIGLYHQGVWDSLINGINLVQRNSNSIGPLMSTRWAQKGCNNGSCVGYEYSMPQGNTCDHCVAGCVAVAMGQVMNYWKYPVSTKWDLKFDWCNMSDILDCASPAFVQNRNAISHLLYDCGVNVSMIYGCFGSGAYFDSVRGALVNRYGYSSDAEYKVRSGMNDNQWMDLLRQEIDAGRPVLYNACEGSCHAFVCDGYGNDNFFNFNWGSRGEGDGSYLIDCLNPYFNRDTHYFTYSHTILIKVHPESDISLCDRDVYLDDYYGLHQNEIASGAHQPWEMLPVTVTNLTSASSDSPSSWRTIPTGEESTYRAQESITLKDGFTVESGAEFAAIITPCDNCGNREYVVRMHNSPMDNASEHVEQRMQDYSEESFLVEESSMSFLPSGNCEEVTGIRVHPNPAHGTVAVTLAVGAPQDAVLRVLDASGHEVLSQPVTPESKSLSLDLSALSAGTYFVVLITTQGTTTQKLILE